MATIENQPTLFIHELEIMRVGNDDDQLIGNPIFKETVSPETAQHETQQQEVQPIGNPISKETVSLETAQRNSTPPRINAQVSDQVYSPISAALLETTANLAATVTEEQTRNIIPIIRLRQDLDAKKSWLRVKVIKKMPIYPYTKNETSEQFANIDLSDQSTVLKLRSTMFHRIVDEFYNVLQEGKIYFISNVRIQRVNRSFLGDDYYDYQLIYRNDTKIVEVHSLI